MIDPTGIFDDQKFSKMAFENNQKFINAKPFPHIYFDNFLDTSLANEIKNSFPDYNDELSWVIRDTENIKKRYQGDDKKLPKNIRLLLREFNSKEFLLFLEALTGIEYLIPDPYLINGGVHMSKAGDYLGVHVDFNWNHMIQANRRVNVLLYLTPSWNKEWNGALELFEPNADTPSQTLYPEFNRLVIFQTSGKSYHGHPVPLNTPDGVYRRALNLYYYSRHKDDDYEQDPHFTKYTRQSSEFALNIKKDYQDSANQKNKQ
jgi:Rps23 Pro-64 3,4-dihydroxylase Tpa1-like proline 4-hydroxylase